ncbi:hypothetical protein [Nocardia cyriacigeorgica]|uniref:hypothetical protein n=1 Tax=Nocardia cyriacigeorgica TaxID=135487 RepID=UPI002454FFC1|nr:hypothetical protein [Nocardia cyriacigeorgica]
MTEPELTDAERARIREILEQSSPGRKEKMKTFAAGLFTGVVAVAGVLIGYSTWEETREANEISRQANHGNLSFEAQFTGPDEKRNGEQKIRVDEKVITEAMFRKPPSFIRLIVKNDGPQNSFITDVGLQLGGGEFLWASTLAREQGIADCNPQDGYDHVACVGLFPKEIAPGLFTFDFPMWDSVDRLLQNGGDENGGIKFTFKTVGAGNDQIDFSTGITIR